MPDVLQKFGKYFLLDLLAQGGMAEVFRARMATKEGGDRLVAIKRVIPSYSSNDEFVAMFKSEIKTTSSFTHPNITQIYDYGEEEGMLYITMELVDGRNLRQILGHLDQRKKAGPTVLPLEVSMYIIEQAAQGIGYAHGYHDKFSGKALGLVHRDISPQNVLVSYDGAVKIIDFGIAKAITNLDMTRSGIIKGKPSYLSPEQVSGEALDQRSDLFSLGTVFWELLTGRKLFFSDNDYGILRLIENCNTHVKPPSFYQPSIPKELDTIVMRCLQRDPGQRFANASDLQRALHKLLYALSPDFNPADLSFFIKDLFKDEIVEDRKRIASLNARAEKVLATQKKKNEEAEVEKSKTHALSGRKLDTMSSFHLVDGPDSNKNNVIELDNADKPALPLGGSNDLTAKPSMGPRPTRVARVSRSLGQTRRNSWIRPVLFAAIAIVAVVFSLMDIGRKPAGGPGSGGAVKQNGNIGGTGTITIQGNPRAATIFIDGVQVGKAVPKTVSNLPTGKPLKIEVLSNSYGKFSQLITLSELETRTLAIDLPREDKSQESARRITLNIRVNPLGVGNRISVDGRPIDISGVVSVAVDRPVEVLVERDGYKSERRSVMPDPIVVQGGGEQTVEFTLEAAKFGFVSIQSTPSADVLLVIDGQQERWTTPVSRRRLPIGVYKAKLVNKVLDMEKEISFSVQEDRFTNVDEKLTTK